MGVFFVQAASGGAVDTNEEKQKESLRKLLLSGSLGDSDDHDDDHDDHDDHDHDHDHDDGGGGGEIAGAQTATYVEHAAAAPDAPAPPAAADAEVRAAPQAVGPCSHRPSLPRHGLFDCVC